jgi:polysaccharide deacetylase 2 family uncharacterized protein YibQ
LVSDQETVILSDLTFDSETLPVPKLANAQNKQSGLQENSSETIPSPPSDENIGNVSALPNLHQDTDQYPVFSSFKVPLTTNEKTAILEGSPLLSVILTETGLSRALNQQIIEKLSDNVTLSLSPYIEAHNPVANMFSEYGFEIWMDIAAITLDMNQDHGPLALSPVNNFENNINMLSQQLNNKDKVTGVVLPPQALIIETEGLWSDIVSDLYADGYGIIDNTVQVMKPGLFFHEDRRAPYLKTDQTLEENLTLDQLKTVLSNIRKSVKEQGNMIISLPVTSPAALDILADWVNSLEEEGITLVPASAQAKI